MNERIRQIAEQCTEVLWRDGPYEREEFNKEKFARLIAEAVLDQVEQRAYYTGDRAWSDELDRPWIQLEFGYGALHDAKTKGVKP
jgi:hypothetical protein